MSIILRSKVIIARPIARLRLTPPYRPYASGVKIPENFRLPETSSASEENTKEYVQACERIQRIEKQLVQSSPFRDVVDDDIGDMSGLLDAIGPPVLINSDDRMQAQFAVERLSKYAWVACNNGAKFILSAGDLYFSLDAYCTNPSNDFYHASVAKRKSTAAIQEDRSEGGNTSDYIFPYHPRQNLFRVSSLAEGIRFADTLVEKMITGKKILSTTNAIMEYEEDALPSNNVEQEEGALPMFGELENMTGSYANFVLSNGLYDAES
ncbi:hypothetical protein QFC22_005840 [Naganishia vaughanmartiniae]|uniref:Uncharacterized protein n=1 Tax=Naganishia vaughanmartiniae TaxID=1424756 RepID=A0ACC2WRS9_9TREE|nr:hypothetical protein QFC22_005840 [Naganishia vaughanmartiniae]